jgi:hypothetical protein
MLAEHHAVERSEMQGLTYGEVDILSFVKMLRLAGARDNQVFVDLVSYTSFSPSLPPGMRSWENSRRLGTLRN